MLLGFGVFFEGEAEAAGVGLGGVDGSLGVGGLVYCGLKHGLSFIISSAIADQ